MYWLIVLLFLILSVCFLSGKAAILIAGYNLLSREEKKVYDEVRLCRIVGFGFSVLTIILAISAYYNFDLPPSLSWLIPWGYLAIGAFMLLLANTFAKEGK